MRLDDNLQDARDTAGRTTARAARAGEFRVTTSVVFVILCLAACSSVGGSATSQSSTDSAEGGASSDDAGEESDAGEASADGDGGTDGCGERGCAPDVPNMPTCDPFVPNCPAGEKCTPVAEDPSTGSWDAFVCVPEGDQPIGAPCTYVDGGVNGQDTCEGPGLCAYPGATSGVGQCVEQCSWAGGGPSCPSSGETCVYTVGSGSLGVWLCLPSCDPLDAPCWDGAVCIAEHEDDPLVPSRFRCAPQGTDSPAAPGEPCDCQFCCQNGAICENPGEVGLENCPDVDLDFQACCTALCDITLPDPDLACADAALVGTVCVALTPPGTPEPLGKVGKCVLPP